MRQYYVYILSNKYNTVLYTGVTNDIERRVYEHQQKLNKGFTSKYNCHKLVWFEDHEDVLAAIHREKQIKKWLRTWKNQLIEKENPQWTDLSNGWYDVPLSNSGDAGSSPA